MCDQVEANVFYEPRPAVAPFYVVPVGADYNSHTGDSFNNRADAEDIARTMATIYEKPFHVVGCVSISSVPQPVPLKAATRALV